MRFVLPHSADDRPAWLVRLGLFLYDHLGGRKKLPGTRVLNLTRAEEGIPLKDQFTKGFEYSDCWVDDARLVILNALDAAHKGAQIRTRTACTAARRIDGHWQVDLHDLQTGKTDQVKSRALVNAGGPWVNSIIDSVNGSQSDRKVRLVKGSHIVVRKFWSGKQAYLVQNDDKRVIFINPYGGDNALIGTTDIPYEGSPEDAIASEEEIRYLINAVNRYFKTELLEQDVIQSFSGVRPLFDDGKGNPSAVTRDYVFDVEDHQGVPILNVFGGKITTFRKLSEHALDKLVPYFPDMGKTWTREGVLPGGDFIDADFERFLKSVIQRYSWLPRELATHYARLYGSNLHQILGESTSLAQLGVCFGKQLYVAEVQYLIDNEWAMSSDDILYRRTKHGLHMDAIEVTHLQSWFEDNYAFTT
jgi:glycerol-3-phosphate dehydrogenase